MLDVVEAPKAVGASERRSEPRETIPAELWMIDHAGETVLKARCSEVSQHGMRLSVPIGYGVAEGQHYELSRLPGRGTVEQVDVLNRSRWVRVVRTAIRVDGAFGTVDVGVTFDEPGDRRALGEV